MSVDPVAAILTEAGLDILPAHEWDRLLAYFKEGLDERVSERLAADLTEEQLDQFDRLMDGDVDLARAYLEASPDREAIMDAVAPNHESVSGMILEAGRTAWMQANAPDHLLVVADELSMMRQAVLAHADDLLHRIISRHS